jgi:hypothetical protein
MSCGRGTPSPETEEVKEDTNNEETRRESCREQNKEKTHPAD